MPGQLEKFLEKQCWEAKHKSSESGVEDVVAVGPRSMIIKIVQDFKLLQTVLNLPITQFRGFPVLLMIYHYWVLQFSVSGFGGHYRYLAGAAW